MKKKQHNKINILRLGDSIKISFNHLNKLSVLNSDEIEKEILKLFNKKLSTIIIDFTGIKFIDSSGFHALLSIHIEAKLKNVNFVLINLNEELFELFKLVELDEVFDIRNNLDFDINFKEAC